MLDSENHERNWRRIKLSGVGTLTLSCSNLFNMTPAERAFILGILEQMEAHERQDRLRETTAMAIEHELGEGCVTNFDHVDPRGSGEPVRLTIWKQSGGRFTLSEFGALGTRLLFSDDPLFQSLAAEIYRLAGEVGKLRRLEIEHERQARRAGV